MITDTQRIINGRLVYAAGDPNSSIWFLSSLLKEGADINAQNEEGYTALHRSLTLKRTELAEFLISKKPNFALQNNNNQTALDIAKIHHHDHLIYNLTIATKAAQVNHKDLQFMMGVKYGFLQKVIEAAEEGADVNMCDLNGTTSLHIASHTGQIEILKYLLSLKDKINLTPLDLHHASPIHYCLMQDNQGIFDEISYLLISSGSNIRINADDDIPALYKLSMRGYNKALAAVTNITEINHKIASVNNNTMLHGAIIGGQFSTVILLVMRGADPAVRNSDGHSSTDIAQSISADIHYFLTSHMSRFIKSIIKGDKNSIEKYIAKDFDPTAIFFYD
jgi:ankyrin repeat protein